MSDKRKALFERFQWAVRTAEMRSSDRETAFDQFADALDEYIDERIKDSQPKRCPECGVRPPRFWNDDESLCDECHAARGGS